MRLNGGVIGKSNEPTNRVASGIWSSEEQRVSQLYDKFPRYYEGWDLTYLADTTPRILSTTVASGINSGAGMYFKPDGTSLYVIDAGTGGELSQYTLSTAWATATMSLSNTFSALAVQQGVAFRPDGRAFFTVGTLNPATRQHTLTTAWSLPSAVEGKFTSIASETGDPRGMSFSTAGDFMYVIGSTGIIYQYSLSTPRDPSTATFLRSSSQTAYDNDIKGIYFSPDGLRMYFVGDQTNNVQQYSLSTAWDISTLTYVSTASASNTTAPTGITFRPDGTRMYITVSNGIQQYNLSTAWDITTRSYSTENFWPNNPAAGTTESATRAAWFKDDGTRLFLVGEGLDRIQEVSMVTPWQVGTFTHIATVSLSGVDASPQDIVVSPDGRKFYILGSTTDRVYELGTTSLTAWDTANLDFGGRLSSAIAGAVHDLVFNNDGTKLFFISSTTDTIREYALSGAYDLNTAVLTDTFSISAQTGVSVGLNFSSDGLAMYVTDDSRLYKYTLLYPWAINSATFSYSILIGNNTGTVLFKSDGTEMYLQNLSEIYRWSMPVPKELRSPGDEGGFFSINAQDASSTDLTLSTDGNFMYVVGNDGDDINQYALSTPWNVTTASFVRSLAVGGSETVPTGIAFKPDGTRMYIIGSGADNIREFSLSTAWDISTASFVRALAIGSQEATSQAITFSPDGIHMFVIGNSGQDVNQYALSTAWDISTATFVRASSPIPDTVPTGIVFRPDGLRMYILGSTTDLIYQYNLNTAWNVSAITLDKTLPIGYLEATPTGLAIKTDGTKLYIVGNISDNVCELNLG